MELPDEIYELDLGRNMFYITPEEARNVKNAMFDAQLRQCLEVMDINGFAHYVRVDKIIHLSYAGKNAREANYELDHAFCKERDDYERQNFPTFD